MESIKDFYKKLNRSVSGEENRKLWEHFREAVTGFVMEEFIEGGSTIVIGAGNMNDFDLKTITDASESVVLADIDTETISKNLPKKTKAAEIDFGCLDALFSITDSIELKQALKTSKPRVLSSIVNEKFNNILISPFYTQIILPWIFPSLSEVKPESELVETALDLAAKVIAMSNEYIRSLAGSNCRLCLWTDMLEYDKNNPAFIDIVSNISDNIWMDDFFNQYTDEFGYGLGSYGHAEMEEYIKNKVHKWIIWPFDQSRNLVVKITSGTL